MSKIVILGSSSAVASENHANTHMVVKTGERMVLIDTTGNSVVRMKQAGLDHEDLTDVVLTHFHPDHISGISLLLMTLWLLGRKAPLNIVGLEEVLDHVRQVMRFHGADEWPDVFPIHYIGVPETELFEAINCDDFRLKTSPVRHIVPTIGVRMEFPKSGVIFAYSADTEPCEAVVNLGRNADIFIHEATGESFGHSSAAQAGDAAFRAGARSLYLIHYPTFEPAPDPEAMVAEAKKTFHGTVERTIDFMEIPLKLAS